MLLGGDCIIRSCNLCRNYFSPKVDTSYYENNQGFCIKLMRLISNNYSCEDLDHSDNLTHKQRENHKKMVEDMTGRKIL